MAQAPLRESLSTLDEKYLAALLSAGFRTASDVANFRGSGLQRQPHCDDTFARFVLKLHDSTDTIDIDGDDDLSILSSVVDHCANLHRVARSAAGGPPTPTAVAVAASVTDMEKKREADIFGATAYQAANEKFLMDLPPGHQVSGKMVKAMSEDLDAGRLNPEACKLPKLQLVSSAENEIRTNLGAGVSIGTTEEVHVLGRIGEVLMAIMRFMYMMLAAGGRVVTPNVATPWAGGKGDLGGFIEVDEAGVPQTKRWHVTPASVHRYWAAACEACITLSPTDLVVAHEMLHAKVRAMIVQGFNYESSLFKVLDSHSFTSILSMATGEDRKAHHAGPKTTTDRGGGGGSRGDSSKSSRNERKKKSEPERSVGKVKKVGSLCHDFNNPGEGCRRGGKCVHVHACETCGSRMHGAVLCPETSPEASGDSKRRK